MSFINEALKKAQKDRDTLRVKYQGVLAVSERNKTHYTIKVIGLFILVLIIGALVIRYYPLIDLERDKVSELTISQVKESIEPVLIQEAVANMDLIYKKALALYKDKDLKEAKKLYLKALNMDPGYVDALNNLGVIHIHDKEYEAAQINFKKAIRLKPSYVDPYYNLACLYSLTGEVDQGLLYLNKAISINPAVKEWAEKDSDLKELRASSDFYDIMKD